MKSGSDSNREGTGPYCRARDAAGSFPGYYKIKNNNTAAKGFVAEKSKRR